MLAQLSQLFALFSVLALVWLVIHAFQRHWLWGLGVLLLSPISATIFGIKYWRREKLPFLAYILTFVPAVSLGFYVFSALGGWEVVNHSMNVHRGIQTETLTEQDAIAFMRSNLNFIENGVTDERDQRQIDVMKHYLDKFESGSMSEQDIRELNTEMLELASEGDLDDEQRRQLEEIRNNLLPPLEADSVPKNYQGEPRKNNDAAAIEGATESAPDNPRIKTPKLRMKLVKIDIADAANFIGHTFKVKGMNGIVRTYRLIESSPRRLRFERREQGGMLTFNMEKWKIKELKVYTRQDPRSQSGT